MAMSTSQSADAPDAALVGSHCGFASCRQLDLLPFACPSCDGVFCRDHRIEVDHRCPHAGAWAARRRQQQLMRPSVGAASAASSSSPPGPCAAPGCLVTVRKPLSPATRCSRCHNDFCLSHRLFEDHECRPPQSPQPSLDMSARALATLDRLRVWAATTARKSSGKPAARQPAASAVSSLLALKQAARGDARVPMNKRVYVHTEAARPAAATASADMFFAADWPVGRVLDVAARELAIDNVNNTAADEADRLRVFHVEAGRLLNFTELFGATVASGNTIVLLRGVGAPPPLEAS